MKSNYKRLGYYIRQVDVRNRDLAVNKLVGLTIDKAFIPSVANIVGTDLSSYKVIINKQFACSLMQVSRDKRMPIAMFKGDKAIMSPAYPMFEVYREKELIPEFLMMWFSRPEFDRQAAFYAVGGVRGSLTWEDFCDFEIPVPPIEEQQKIVAEYQVIERRIENNRRLIATLEEIAKAIYRKMFVDNIDPENLPDGWRMGTIGELFELQRGHDLPSQNRIAGKYPIYASTGINGYHNEFKAKAPCVVTGRSGTIGVVNYVTKDFWPLNTTLFVKDCAKSSMEFAYFKLKDLKLENLVAGFAAVPTLNRNDIHMMQCSIPPHSLIVNFSMYSQCFFSYIENVQKEITHLESLKSIIFFKLSKL